MYISIYQINKIIIFCQKNNLFDINNDKLVNIINLTEYIENTFYLKLDKKFEFADSALEALSKQHTIFIVTARQDVLAAEKQIEQFGFTRYIQRSFITRQQITKSDLIQNSKIILNRGDVFVGDTGVDIQSAQALGVTSVAVLSGSRNRASLEKYKPDFIYRDLNEFVLDFKINIH